MIIIVTFFSFWLCQFDCSFVILDFKLADFPYDVEDSILQLDSDSSPVQKNWKHVAYEYEITKQTIQVLERECRKPGISAIRLLIEKLCSSKCATLKEFVDVLQELERNDVANDIISWFRQKQDRCSEEDKNWQYPKLVGFFIDILYHAWTLRTMTIDNNCDDRFSLANWKTESSRTAQ